MATAKENLEDFITCSVCLEKFEGRDPRLLPCGHAFCLTCIQDIHRTARANPDTKLKDDEFRCPQCTTISAIPGQSIIHFPTFFYATHIQDAIKAKQPQLCQNDQRSVSGYCFTCTKTFCDQCLTKHNKSKNNHNHVEVNKDNIKALVCAVHEEMVEAFCTDCCKAVCAECQMTEHENHRFSDFVIGAQLPSTLLSEITKKQETCKDNIQGLETMQKEFNAHILGVKDKITDQTEHVIAQIIDQSQVLQSDLSMFQTSKNEEIENMKTLLKTTDDAMAHDHARILQLTQPVPELPLVGVYNKDQLISKIKQQIPQMWHLNDDSKAGPRYQFTPQTAAVMLGTLTALQEPLDKQKVYPNRGKGSPRGSVPSYKQDVSQPTGATAAPVSAEAVGSFFKQASSLLVAGAATHTQPRLVSKPRLVTHVVIGDTSDLSWTPSGDVILAADYNMLKMCNKRGESLSVPCDLSGVEGRVCSVAVQQQQSIVALVAGELFSERHLYIASLVNHNKALRVCDLSNWWICQVTFSTGGDVLVCAESSLLKYSINGNQIWERSTKHKTNYVTTTTENKIIVCGDRQLSVHDQDGHWLSSFPKDTATLRDPRGVCADSRGHVFVIDNEYQAVQMYTSDGTYVRQVVQVQGRPGYMALYQDRYLAVKVLDHKCLSRLHIYEI